ncbi:MAG: OmpH family outer membrane protein [Phycisphaeraceae bacterium]|nr:OmpH family outer membrane protein [Phycisphaeraceae bacterium]
MRRSTQAALIGILGAALLVLLMDRLLVVGGSTAHASGHGAAVADPASDKIATCDIYMISDKLMESDRFKPELTAAGDKMKGELETLQTELQTMADKLKGMSPQDADAQQLYHDFQEKQRAAQQKQAEMSRDLEKLFAIKYVEAYKQVRASAEAVGRDLGYTYVIASKQKDDIQTEAVQVVIQGILARPVIVAPEGTDITEDVVKDLKL